MIIKFCLFFLITLCCLNSPAINRTFQQSTMLEKALMFAVWFFVLSMIEDLIDGVMNRYIR